MAVNSTPGSSDHSLQSQLMASVDPSTFQRSDCVIAVEQMQRVIRVVFEYWFSHDTGQIYLFHFFLTGNHYIKINEVERKNKQDLVKVHTVSVLSKGSSGVFFFISLKS